jgi:hypothetical protein
MQLNYCFEYEKAIPWKKGKQTLEYTLTGGVDLLNWGISLVVGVYGNFYGVNGNLQIGPFWLNKEIFVYKQTSYEKFLEDRARWDTIINSPDEVYLTEVFPGADDEVPHG